MIGVPIRIQQADTVRLLTSARLREQSLKPLYDTPEEEADLVSLEYVTHGRLQAQVEGLRDLDHRELVFGVPNFTFINAAFSYPRPGGNRFNDEHRGAWYCATEVETALAEVTFHMTRALADASNAFENTTDFAELFADFVGTFQDIRGVVPRPDCLHEDPSIGYPSGQLLARAVRMEAQLPGIVYPSCRQPGGTCMAILTPVAIQNVRQGALWRLTWSGTPEPEVSRP